MLLAHVPKQEAMLHWCKIKSKVDKQPGSSNILIGWGWVESELRNLDKRTVVVENGYQLVALNSNHLSASSGSPSHLDSPRT